MGRLRAFFFIALVALALDANGNDADQKSIITDDIRGSLLEQTGFGWE